MSAQLESIRHYEDSASNDGTPDGLGSETIFGGSGNPNISGSNGGNYFDTGSAEWLLPGLVKHDALMPLAA